MKLQFLAVPLLVVLMLAPALAAAAPGTLTFTSPAAGSTLNGTESYTISGTITPNPVQPDYVNIQVTNPASQVVDVQTVDVSSTGTFSYSTNVGGNTAWTTGTYKILATDSYGATNTETFEYTATQSQTSGQALVANARSAAIVYAGQTVEIFAAAYWTNNGTSAKSVTWTASVWGPTGTSSGLTWTASSPATGAELWTATLPTTASDGVYAAAISVTDGVYTTQALTSFQVNSQIASTSGLSSITSTLSSITSSLTSLSTSVGSISSTLASVQTSVSGLSGLGKNITSLSTSVAGLNSAVSGLSSQLTSISSTIGTINTNVQGLGTSISTLTTDVQTINTSIGSITTSINTLTTDVTGLQSSIGGISTLTTDVGNLQTSVGNLSTSVSNAQTYVLVVAVLAVITLVLELAILIRKMS